MNIYKMKLHDSFWDSTISKSITRVPGGWLYGDWDTEREEPAEGATFVPFNNEFVECSEKGEQIERADAPPEIAEICEWKNIENDMGGFYHTTCGERVQSILEIDGMRFCPYCSRKLRLGCV